VFAYTTQLGFTATKTGTDVTLDQTIRKAEACPEIIGQGYKCCPCDLMNCYLGGGFTLLDHLPMYS